MTAMPAPTPLVGRWPRPRRSADRFRHSRLAGASRPQPRRTRKQQRDAQRIRIRLDAPPLIKKVLLRVAEGPNTGTSQAATRASP